MLRLRGRPGGALTNLTIEIPAGWSIAQGGSVELEGEAFRSASLAVEGGRITIRDAALTNTQTGSVVLSSVLPPAAVSEGPATFRIVTSTGGGDGREIQASPKAIFLRTIESLRRTSEWPKILWSLPSKGRSCARILSTMLMVSFYVEGGGSTIRVVFDIEEIRNYCETDVINTYLIYLLFELMRGRLTHEEHDRECALVRGWLGSAGKAHLAEFLAAWTPAAG